MKIGAQMFTVRDYCQTGDDFRRTLEKLAKIGYEYLQISGVCQMEYDYMKKCCDEFSLKAVITHNPDTRILNETDKLIEGHKILGADYIGLGAMPARYLGRADGAQDFVKDFAKAFEKIRKAGLYFSYHNHSFEYERYGDTNIMKELIRLTSDYDVKFTLDTYWVQAGGKSILEQIYELEGRVDVCHLKDFNVRHEELRMAAIGKGNINFVDVMNAFEKIGTKYAMVEQDNCYGLDPFSELEYSFNKIAEIRNNTK